MTIPKRLIIVSTVGLVACVAAAGFRFLQKPGLIGTWRGYGYYQEDGQLLPNREFGVFVIDLKSDGTYAENGNSTSGVWSRKDDRITLQPTHFYGMTPEEHLKRYRRSDGKPSATISGLLNKNMKPMLVVYSAATDRLTYVDSGDTLKYIYDRAR